MDGGTCEGTAFNIEGYKPKNITITSKYKSSKKGGKYYDNEGKEIHKKKGELVCKSSFPSKPLFFWNDKNNIKLQKAYFNKYNNIWHQSDYAESTENNGYIIYGRSDATLNSGGVRIGTAELYRVVENINNVMECVAVEQKYNNDTIILLFIKLKDKIQLDENFIKNIIEL